MNDPASLRRRLARLRAIARGVIWFERLVPALTPAFGVAALFVSAALLNVVFLLSGWAHLAVLALVGALTLGLLVYSLRRTPVPDFRAADRRLELGSGLRHGPLAVMADKPATTDAAGLALWQAHTDAAIARIGGLKVGLPHPGLAGLDRFSLRNALVLLLLVSLAVANTGAPGRLYAALTPALPGLPAAPATELKAWITPPPYTREPPIFVKGTTGALSVPAGSRVTVNVSGGSETPRLSVNDQDHPFTELAANSFQVEWDMVRGGVLRVGRDNGTLARWTVSVVADQAPQATWTGKPGPGPTGRDTRLPWQTSDDYGVDSLQAELRLRDRPDVPPVVVAIPLTAGSPKTAQGTAHSDLTAHPWAGLSVTARLIARDAAGQTGTSADAAFELPERPFHNEIARVLIAIRKNLTVNPEDRLDSIALLDGLLQQPAMFGGDIGAYVTVSWIYREMVRNRTEAAVPTLQATMWELALHLEEGQTEQSARALAEARHEAREALNKVQQQPNDANKTELAKRLEQLRQALNAYMQNLLNDAQRNNDISQLNPSTMRQLDREFDRMANDAQRLANQGRMDEAQQQMAELEKMLDQVTKNPSAAREAMQAKNKRRASAVPDLIAREGALVDQAQRRFGHPQSGNQGDPSAQRDTDARVQQALRRSLGELMQQFSDMTGDVAPGLGEADQAMRNAMTSLKQGSDDDAARAQQQAIAALQKGGKEMQQAMAKANGSQSGQGDESGDGEGDEPGGVMALGSQGDGSQGAANEPSSRQNGRPDQGQRDVLGRNDQNGLSEGVDGAVPDDRETVRTRIIQEELRRRETRQDRPQQELHYIDRLLKQF